jgi:hypothetical protein
MEAKMSREIKESDWKVLRQLHPIALERFCRRALDEIERTASDTDKSCHERYVDVLGRVKQLEREMADAFDDMRRSMAFQRLLSIQSHELLTEEELERFSPEMRGLLRSWFE